jgi:protein-tyrosine phosphatase
MERRNYKRLPFKRVANFRDLGGYPTQDGKMTRYGVFFRSGDLHQASPQDIKLLQELEVKTVIDLRYRDEFEKMPDACVNSPGIQVINISLFAELAPERLAVRHGEANTVSLVKMYIQMTEECGERLATLFHTLARRGRGATLLHCAVGKDRTGVAAMFLLEIAGVADADIIADYEVSHTYMNGFSNDVTGSHYDNMRLFLKYLSDKYGSPVGYLRRIGVKDGEIEALRRRMVI